jgi:hypothetical protein
MLILIKVINIVLSSLLFNTISPIAWPRLRFVGPIYFGLSSADYYHSWIQFLTLDPALMTNLSQSWLYMADVWSHVPLGDRFIDHQYPVWLRYQCCISWLDLLIACQIWHWRLIDLSVKKSMASTTCYVPIGYLADGLSLHAYDMPSWLLCDIRRSIDHWPPI